MSATCAKCSRTVYKAEELKCLEKVLFMAILPVQSIYSTASTGNSHQVRSHLSQAVTIFVRTQDCGTSFDIRKVRCIF